MNIEGLFAKEVRVEIPELPKIRAKFGEIEVYNVNKDNISKFKELSQEAGKLSPTDKKGIMTVAVLFMDEFTNIPFDKLNSTQIENLMINPSQDFMDAKKEVENMVNEFNENIAKEREEIKEILPKKEIEFDKKIEKEFGDIKIYALDVSNAKEYQKLLEFLAKFLKSINPENLVDGVAPFNLLDKAEILSAITNIDENTAIEKLVLKDENCLEAIKHIAEVLIPQIQNNGMDGIKKATSEERREQLNAVLTNDSYTPEMKMQAKILYDKINKEDGTDG